MSSNKMATLVSYDSTSVQASLEAVKQSVTISTMLEILDEEKTTDLSIPIPEIPGFVLRKVMEWCEHHRNDLPSIDDGAAIPKAGDKNVMEKIPRWDREFFEVERNMIFQITNTANYLEIPLLQKYGLHIIASEIKGKEPEQMRAYLKTKNDFAPAEEAELRQRNSWTEADQSKYPVPHRY